MRGMQTCDNWQSSPVLCTKTLRLYGFNYTLNLFKIKIKVASIVSVQKSKTCWQGNCLAGPESSNISPRRAYYTRNLEGDAAQPKMFLYKEVGWAVEIVRKLTWGHKIHCNRGNPMWKPLYK